VSAVLRPTQHLTVHFGRRVLPGNKLHCTISKKIYTHKNTKTKPRHKAEPTGCSSPVKIAHMNMLIIERNVSHVSIDVFTGKY